jgi:hypothetical protein
MNIQITSLNNIIIPSLSVFHHSVCKSSFVFKSVLLLLTKLAKSLIMALLRDFVMLTAVIYYSKFSISGPTSEGFIYIIVKNDTVSYTHLTLPTI